MEWFNIISEYGIQLTVIICEALAIIHLYKDNKAIRDKNDERTNGMMEKIGDLTDAVNTNTLSITQLIDKLDVK